MNTLTAARSPIRRRLPRLAVGALFGVLIALLLAAPVAAQEATATASPVGGSVTGFGVGEWMNLLLRLALVLVVIWFAITAMRWWVRRMNGGAGSGSGHLQIVETRTLGPNRSLQLVRLGNRAVLLGVTSERISSVLEISDPAEVERLTRPTATQRPPTSLRDAVSRLGSLTQFRPVIERKRSTPRAAASAQTAHSSRPTAMTTVRSGAPTARPANGEGRTGTTTVRSAPAARSRWLTLGRRIIGLEDPPPRRAMAAGANARPRPAASAARPPTSLASARAAAAELPASRAVRARSGYRQNQIAEAQRAISSVRAQMPR